MIPRRALDHRYELKAGQPWAPAVTGSASTFTVTVFVASSAAVSRMYGPNTRLNRIGLRPGYLPRYASRLFFTTVAVSGVPSWNLTPSRRTIVHVVASAFESTDFARDGTNLPFSSGAVSVS